MSIDKIQVRVFRAPEDPVACAEFIFNHVKLLKDLGINPISIADNSWIDDKNVVLTVAYQENKMIAGMRLHCIYSQDAKELPMVTALKKEEPAIMDYMEKLRPNGVAECCGMWNSKEFSGKRVSTILGIAGFAIMPQLNVKYTIGLIAKYTLSQALKVGYQIERSFGDEGYFQYPKPGFYGIVIRTDLPTILTNAQERWRKRVLSLSGFPVQVRSEQTDTAKLNVDYDLIVNNSVIGSEEFRKLRVGEQRDSRR